MRNHRLRVNVDMQNWPQEAFEAYQRQVQGWTSTANSGKEDAQSSPGPSVTAWQLPEWLTSDDPETEA